MIDSSYLTELKRFSLIVNKRLTSKYTGERKSIFSGSGNQFKDHRPYSIGDDFRKIDWKVYARTDDLYIKLYEEERNLNTHILLDNSKSMSYNDKFDFAGKLALGFSYIGTKDNEKVSFSTFSENVKFYKPGRGKSKLMNMLDQVNSTKTEGKTKLFNSIQEYKRMINYKSYIVIISDFLTDQEDLMNALYLLGKKHIVKVIQVMHPDELRMPFEGDYKLVDSETKETLPVYISKKGQQKYVQKMQQHTQKLRDVCKEMKFDFYQFPTDKPIFDCFFEVLNK